MVFGIKVVEIDKRSPKVRCGGYDCDSLILLESKKYCLKIKKM